MSHNIGKTHDQTHNSNFSKYSAMPDRYNSLGNSNYEPNKSQNSNNGTDQESLGNV
jgi:hypothetical protein